jgi:hypothetical protein
VSTNQPWGPDVEFRYDNHVRQQTILRFERVLEGFYPPYDDQRKPDDTSVLFIRAVGNLALDMGVVRERAETQLFDYLLPAFCNYVEAQRLPELTLDSKGKLRMEGLNYDQKTVASYIMLRLLNRSIKETRSLLNTRMAVDVFANDFAQDFSNKLFLDRVRNTPLFRE